MRHTLSPAATLFHADCRDALKTLPDNSIDSVVCDPPYHLTSVVKRFGGENAAPAQYGTDGAFARASKGFMQKSWDGGDIAFRPETWAEVLRVLKPGGYCAAFGAPRNFGRLQCAIYDAGFEERDTILNILDPDDAIVQFLESLNEPQLDAFMRCLGQSDMAGFLAWTFGTGFPKSQNVALQIDKQAGAIAHRGKGFNTAGQDRELNANQELRSDHPDYAPYSPITDAAKEWSHAGTALKPAFEPIVLARKPLSEGTVAANVLRWRTGALNIDASRIHTGESTARVYTAKRTAPGATQNATGERHTDEVFEGASKEGRWPANVVLTFPEETFTFADNVDGSQRAEVETWLAENT